MRAVGPGLGGVHLQHEIGPAQERRRVRREGGARSLVGLVGEVGRSARSSFDRNLDAEGDQLLAGLRIQRDAGLARPDFPGNGNLHGGLGMKITGFRKP